MALTLNNDLKTLKVGDYFWCKYIAPTTGQVGTFSDMATKTDAEATPVIPVASSATPTGYFKYIVVDDYNGKKKLIADRNIQNAISWDVLNSAGIASGSGLPTLFNGYDPKSLVFTTRLLTGGTSATDLDNEWDKYIVNSTLGGTITAGDNGVWNWKITDISKTSTLTSTTGNTNTVRAYRSGQNPVVVNYWGSGISSATSAGLTGFRPVLEIESLFTLLNKSFILSSDGYKKMSGGDTSYSPSNITSVPKMTSDNTPSGIASASAFYTGFNPYYAFDGLYDGLTKRWAISGTNVGWLRYDFGTGSKKVIVKYAIVGIDSDSTGLTQNPKDWTFEGSNDGTNWIILDTQLNITNWTQKEKKNFVLTNSNSYQMYRINITANNGNATNLSLSELEMFENIATTTPLSWETVSPTLPILTQFQEEGMDDLSIFDRKIQKVLESPKAMTGEVLGIGKVYKSSVNLNKYFDLRKIEVK